MAPATPHAGAPATMPGTAGTHSASGGRTANSGSGGAANPGNGGAANPGNGGTVGGPVPDAGSRAGTDAGSGEGSDAAIGVPDGSPSAGDVRVVKRMGDSSFDAVVTNPSATTVTWLNDHFYRMEVFTTFFDAKTSWYSKGLVYWDSAVIYPGSSTATSHPDWILQDAAGQPVYLDWNCAGGKCPQYAADIDNPAFRRYWIDGLKAALVKGYAGAWIDDVNLALRFSDGTKSVTASSPATKTVMTEDTWSAAVASFMTEVRAALPGYELLHNSVWYARPTRSADAYVKQEILAADVINMEGGFASDGGLTGGTGEWSVSAKMSFADAVHAAGRWVVVDDFPKNAAEREYALACYFLLTNGKDGIGDADMSPTTWWSGYDVHLGAAVSARSRTTDGVFRREFEKGLVLMLEPGSTNRTIALPKPYLTIDGTELTEVSLSARHGAVLRAK